MKRLLLLLLAPVLFAGQARYARLGEFEGSVEIQGGASDSWQPALRNMPLGEGARVRTATGARAEIEFDDGSALRLCPESLAELSDYTRLATGQRLTFIALDLGLAYFTGQAEGRDSLIVAAPGAEAAIRSGARIRLQAAQGSSRIAIIEGTVRFSSPAAELDIKEGRTVRVEPAQAARFYLYNEVASLDTDRWSEERDKALAAATSGAHTPGLKFGLADLDAGGAWIETAEFGTVWKPKAAAGWAPFRLGKWVWLDALGFTWISADPWGWLPYHYGRWMLHEKQGWIWCPGRDTAFSPGDVYWLRGTNLLAWGPLAPAEEWTPPARPLLYLAANTTYAPFTVDTREIDPAGFTPPRQPVLAFVAAAPSPALTAARVKARPRPLRASGAHVEPFLEGVSFEERPGAEPPVSPAAAPPVISDTQPVQPVQAAPVIVAVPPPQPPAEVYYPVPVPTGIVVINPPERGGRGWRHANTPEPKPAPKQQPAALPLPRPAMPAAPHHEVTRERPPQRRAEPRREEKKEPAKTEESKPEPDKVSAPAGERTRRKQ